MITETRDYFFFYIFKLVQDIKIVQTIQFSFHSIQLIFSPQFHERRSIPINTEVKYILFDRNYLYRSIDPIFHAISFKKTSFITGGG